MELGYSKRVVAIVFAELADAGLAAVREDRNAKLYRLARPNTWEELVGASGLVFPSWSRVMWLMLLSVELWDQRGKSSPVRRVLATKFEDRFESLAMELSLNPPPPVRGDPDAWDHLVEWVARQLMEVADGTSLATGDGELPAPSRTL